MAKKSAGKVFEANLQKSAKDTGIYFYRLKDQYIPPELRGRVPVSRNDFDCLMFSDGHLFTLELKSTKAKSFSFDEKIIKAHQIEKLTEAGGHEGVITGFLFNFREPENRLFFLHIDDFNAYKNVAQGRVKEHSIQSKINKASLPLDYCIEAGIEIGNYKMRTNYHYHLEEFIEEAIQNYSS